MYETVVSMPVAAPFRLDLTVWVLRRREKNSIDRWNGRSYSRILVFNNLPVKLTVTEGGTPHNPHLTIQLQSHAQLSSEVKTEAQVMLRKVLGLAVTVEPFYFIAGRSLVLERLARQFIGVRPPRFPTVFEALVNAIACQQVSLDVGILLLNRLAERFGMTFSYGDGTMHAFPSPEDMLDASESTLKQLGFSYQKARAIKALALIAANDGIHFEQLNLVDDEEALGRLLQLHGIGRWSAEYVLLRGLGRLDIFPGDDVGAQNNLRQLLGLDSRPSYDELKALTAAWCPYAGFAYFHLLLDKLYAKGMV